MVGAIARKLGIREGARAHLVGMPADVLQAIDLPPIDIDPTLTGQFAYIHLFTTSRADMDARFPVLRDHLAPGGTLWLSWPKGGQLGTDLRITSVIEIGYQHGLVESKTIGIDATWSAIKFTHPIPGKTYANSYGRLPD